MSPPLADEVLVKVATPDRRAAANYFAGLIDGGVPLGTLVDSGLAPAMARVGELWDDHLAAHRPDAVLIACSVPMALLP